MISKQNVKFMRKLTFLLTCLFLIGIGVVNAQSKSVSGKVISAEDGQPVIGASVKVVGTQSGTITGVDGDFTVSLTGSAKSLEISYVGMKTVTVEAKNGMIVTMSTDSKMIDEVVVTAMGIKRSEKTLGYSATTVKGDDLANSKTTNVANALAGKVAGVQVQSLNSDPGAATSIVIRGYGSINGANQPLYVVDGVPLQNSTITTSGHSIALSGISNIPAEDIESMTILKGSAATALYGSRASGGVIIVTTKSGTKGKGKNFTIQYDGGIKLGQVAYLPTMQNEFGQGWNGNQTYIENGSWGPALDGSITNYGPVWNYEQLTHKYVAQKNNIYDFLDIGKSYNNAVSINGASNDDKLTYYLSYSNNKDDGIMPTDADLYKRNSIAYRTTFQGADWFKISSNMNFATASTDVVGSYQGSSVIDGLYESPRDISLVDKQDLSSAFNTPEAYYTPYGVTNPYWAIANNYNHTDSKQIFGKVQVDIMPIKALKLTYRFGFDYYDYDRKIGYPQISLDDAAIDTENDYYPNYYGYAPSNMNQSGYVYAEYGRSYEINHDFLANYDNKFGDFSLTAIAGVNMNERGFTGMDGQTTDLSISTGFWQLSNGSTKSTLEESQSKRRMIGLFGDATFGYKDMLFIEGTARNDWSSTLPANKNNYFYPGVTLSWIFTELIPKNDILSFGKVRLAYGKTGRDASAYMTNTSYVQGYANGYYGTDIAQFPMNGSNAFVSSSTAGSATLRPEMTTEKEAGLNLQFLKGKIGLDVAYYNKVTNDQIFRLPSDAATGFTSMVTNFGKVQNKGIELLLTTTPVQTKNYRWDLNFNFSINKNKVLTMPAGLEGGKVSINSFAAGNDAIYMYAEVGKPLGEYYTYLPTYVTDKNSQYYGDIIVDKYGQPVLTEDVEDTGLNMNPDWTGGITSSFTMYGVTLSATLDVRYGGTMFSRTKNLMQFTGNGIVTLYNDRRPFVVPNSVYATTMNGTTTYAENTVALKLADGSYQDYFNDYGYGQGGLAYLVDRSYAKIRNIAISYDLPKKWLKPIYLTGVSLGAYVNNPFMWTAKDNYYVDPESTTTGSDLGGQFGELYTNPSTRVYGFNLSIKY